MAGIDFTPPGKVAAAFMASNSLVRAIRGPIGSGKSALCAMELFRRACLQEPDSAGIRPSRSIIVRNTGPELRTTTIKTWLEWFPEDDFGQFRWSVPYTHHLRLKLADGTMLDHEAIFLALDEPADIKKLLSSEPTFIWINEAREVVKAIVDTASSRVALDRFPPRRRVKPTWRGMVMDTNSPSEDHWWAIMSGDKPVPSWMTDADRLTLVKPPTWKFFTQPPGMLRKRDVTGRLVGYEPNPAAENVQNIGDYRQVIQGKTESWISVYVMNEYGRAAAGKPVYDGYRRELHVARGAILPREGMLEVGVDFGLNPAAVIAQGWGSRVVVLAELIGRSIGAKRFARELKAFLAQKFPNHFPNNLRLWGDPRGDDRSQTDERTPFQMFKAEGFLIRPAPSNDPLIRVEAVNRQLGMLEAGEPGLLVSTECPMLIAGFDGGYSYPERRNASGFDAPRVDKVDKANPYSHPHDALQALLLGMGLGRRVLGHSGDARPAVAPREGSPLGRQAGRRRFQRRGWR